MKTDECAPGCDWPITGYHAKRGGKVLCGMEVKPLSDDCAEGCTEHITCLSRTVKNPLQLLDDMSIVVVSEVVGPSEPGDKEAAEIFNAARGQLLIRPSDPVVWSIIRWMLVGTSEEEINKQASAVRRQQLRSVS